VRRGGRVTSQYIGSGDVALLHHLLDREEREAAAAEALARRQQEEAEQAPLEELEQALDALARQAQAAARDALERAGYRQHKRGEWRRRREPRD
jgi:hypothetical protein